MYKELSEAIDEILKDADESDEFKRRFKKLIANSLTGPDRNEDVRSILRLTKTYTEGGN